MFLIFYNIKVCCVFPLESPTRTHNIPFSILRKKKKITLNYPKSAAMGFFLGTQERVRNSRGKRDISVRATEDLLYAILVRYLRHSTYVHLFERTCFGYSYVRNTSGIFVCL